MFVVRTNQLNMEEIIWLAGIVSLSDGQHGLLSVEQNKAWCTVAPN